MFSVMFIVNIYKEKPTIHIIQMYLYEMRQVPIIRLFYPVLSMFAKFLIFWFL